MPAQIPTLPPIIVSTLPVGTEFPITTFEAHQQNPAVSDGIVVWWDGRNDPDPYGCAYNDDIYGYNINTQSEFPIRVIPADQEYPAISGSTVVWQDWRHFGQYDIYGYYLGTQSEFSVSTDASNQLHPAISGRFVVWTDTRNGWFDSECSCWRNTDIYGYNLDTQTEFPIVTASGDQEFPAISGNTVIWQDNRSGNWDIYGYHLDTHTEFPVRTTSTDQVNPAISGNIVVWEENGNIYGYYLDPQYAFPVSEAPGYQGFPAISEYTIVWEDGRNGDPDIYGYDLINQKEFPVSIASGEQRLPAIWKDVIVWQDNRNGNWDIYGYLRSGWGGPSKIPVVLIHGRSGPADIGKADSVEDDDQLKWIYQWLREDGYKPTEIFYAQGISRYKSIFENAQALKKVIEEVKETTGAAKVDIIAHSMGGINARAYTEVIMRQPDVNRVFMLGTPNLGLLWWGNPVMWELVLNDPERIANFELHPDYMAEFNSTHNNKFDIPYHSVIGTKIGMWLLTKVYGLPRGLVYGDGIVTEASAHNGITGNYNDYPKTDDVHGVKYVLGKPSPMKSYLYPKDTYLKHISPCLSKPSNVLCCTSDSGAQAVASSSHPNSAGNGPTMFLVHTPFLSGVISTGQSITKTVHINSDGVTRFHLMWDLGDLDLSLIDPNGVVIDPVVADGDANIEYLSLGVEGDTSLETYIITNTIPGIWTFDIYGVDTASSEQIFTVFAEMESLLLLEIGTDQDRYQQNESALITASLMVSPTTPVLGSTVIATTNRPDATTDSLTLYDDGAHGDGAEDDGIYANAYNNTNLGGVYSLFVTAEGTQASSDYQRADETIFSVSHQTAALSGSYSDYPEDIDGDGRYDNLIIDIGLNVSGSSSFLLSGVLLDSDGGRIATGAISTTLSAGTHTVPLRFSGELILNSGVDGPYTLSRVILDDSSVVTVKLDEAYDVHTTQSYDHNDFGTLPPTVTGIEPDAGVNNVPIDITVTGTGFLATPSVKIGDTPCLNVTYISSTILTATVPPGIPAGVYTVTVTNPDYRLGTLPNGFTVTNPPPSPPTDLEVGAFPDGLIQLRWEDNSENEDGFKIERSQGISNTSYVEIATVSADTTVYSDTNLVLEESYWYRVRAYNEFGDSDYSNESYNSAFFDVPNFDERYLLLLINEARADPGTFGYPEIAPVVPLAYNPLLNYAAHSHSQAILNSGFQFGHYDLAGRWPTERAHAVGYEGGVGENLIQGMTGPEWVESSNQAFMDSEGHRNNMLAPDFNEAGLGHTYDPAKGGDSYWKGQYTETFSGRSGVIIPNLPAGIVVPYTGPASSDFTYIINYYNADGQAPTVTKVYIDGIPYDMTLTTGTATNGTYRHTTQLAEVGYHHYYFYFEFSGGSARLPETGIYAGPGVGMSCVLFGDFNGDEQVDLNDIQAVASRWRMVYTDPAWNPRYDLNGDGIITVVDIMLVVAHWGETCP